MRPIYLSFLVGVGLVGAVWHFTTSDDNPRPTAPSNSGNRTPIHANQLPTIHTPDSDRQDPSKTTTSSNKAPTAAQTVIDKLQQPYTSATEKVDSLRLVLRESGSPPKELAEGGASLGKLLSQQHIVSDWNCFQAGCYFEISQQSDSLSLSLVNAREQTIPGYVMVLTPESPPNKLMILLNYKQG